MHIIIFIILREYAENHSDCQEALSNWYKFANKAKWTNLVEVQQVFPKAEAVGNFTVFNIKGNKYSGVQFSDIQKLC
ncbi:type II toxin-antitoxin system HigB family toxin [Nostoc sp.]|uniref:type II toxin-antitoxin system HigB family toxin n=1 Tax=Nostoc sp. TaxID=1180 RepID=UPI002FF64FE1